MTTEDLRRYRNIDDEINLLEEEIIDLKNRHTIDAVKSSYSEFPYTEHTQKIYGNDDTVLNLISEKQRQIAKLKALKIEIEQFVNDISDNIVRNIIKYRYIKGYSWAKVASELGGRNTRDGVRKIATRFLKNN